LTFSTHDPNQQHYGKSTLVECAVRTPHHHRIKHSTRRLGCIARLSSRI